MPSIIQSLQVNSKLHTKDTCKALCAVMDVKWMLHPSHKELTGKWRSRLGTVSPALEPRLGTCYNVPSMSSPICASYWAITSMETEAASCACIAACMVVHARWSVSPLHLWLHLQPLFLSFISLQIHWTPGCSSTGQGNTCCRAFARAVLFVLIPLLPDSRTASSLYPLVFVQMSPSQGDLAWPLFTTASLIPQPSYLPAMFSHFSETRTASTTRILLILLIACVTPSPKEQAPRRQKCLCVHCCICYLYSTQCRCWCMQKKGLINMQ